MSQPNVNTIYKIYSDRDMAMLMPWASPAFVSDYSALKQNQVTTRDNITTVESRLDAAETRLDAIDQEIVLINQRIDAVEAAAYMAIIT